MRHRWLCPTKCLITQLYGIQVDTGAPSGNDIKNITPRLDRGLKVIVDRNYDRWSSCFFWNDKKQVQGVHWNCLYWQRGVPPLVRATKRVSSPSGFCYIMMCKQILFTLRCNSSLVQRVLLTGPAHPARAWQRTHCWSWWNPHQHGIKLWPLEVGRSYEKGQTQSFENSNPL